MPALELVKALKQVRDSRAARANAKRRFSHRFLLAAAILLGALSMLAALAALAAAPLFAYITGSMPAVTDLPAMFDPATGSLLQPTRFFDRTGEHMLLELQPPSAPRSFVNALANESLQDAFVASQDPDFWTSADNIWLDLDSRPRGIAEQLTARLLLAREPDSWAKTIRARLLAADAVATYGHEALLNWTVNSATFGHWTFGIESASQLYFAKPAAQLTLAEAALLAAVAQAPALNPHDTPELAIEYQRLVLAAMRDQGMISDLEFTQAYEQPLAFTQPSASGLSGFLQSALTQIENALGRERVLLGGLNVTTTLDTDVQAAMESLLAGTAAAALVLDAPNGRVVAAVGAYDDPRSLDASALLPFEYLSIFASGRSPADLVWSPGPMTTRQALASSNTSTIAQVIALGTAAEAVGLSSEESSLLRISRAYGLLSQNGNLTQAEPSLILFAANETGQIELDLTHANITTPVSAELAFLVTDVLKDASARSGALGDLLQSLHYPAALMPGDEAGVILIGYSPLRVVAIWDQSGVDLELWRQLFDATHAQLPLRDWQVPAGLTSLMVCVPSGQLPDDDCPAVRREWFVAGTEPVENDTLYQRVAINAANNTLATVFTPQSFIEERSFLIVPPESASWARRAGVETPPEDYDTVVAFSGQLGAVSIARPINFSEVSGAVAIRAVLGTNAEYFDIQVGKGLRPNKWTLLTEDDAGSIRSVVTEWDTSGLEGAWTIQLQVWDEDGLLSRAYAIVTLNN
jgi:hypothetical protein